MKVRSIKKKVNGFLHNKKTDLLLRACLPFLVKLSIFQIPSQKAVRAAPDKSNSNIYSTQLQRAQ